MLARKPIYWDGVRKESAIVQPRAGRVGRVSKPVVGRRVKEQWEAIVKGISNNPLTIPVVAIVILLIGLSLSSGSASVMSRNIAQLQKEIVAVTRSNDELKVKVAELKSPTRIQQIAEKQLGMVLPDGFVYNSRNTVVVHENPVDKPIVD